MSVSRFRLLPLAALGALAAALATGCANDSGSSSDAAATPSSSAAATPSASSAGSDEDEARGVVQKYLEAMKAKDLAKGKEQMCPALHDQFDKVASGDEGDFSPKLILKEQSITKVEPKGDDGHRVTTTMVLQAKASGTNPVKADIAFDVHKLGDLWCIYNEEIVGKPTPASS
jgi:hypothetical protein